MVLYNYNVLLKNLNLWLHTTIVCDIIHIGVEIVMIKEGEGNNKKKSRWLQIFLIILGTALIFIVFMQIAEILTIIDNIKKIRESLGELSGLTQSLILNQDLLISNLIKSILCLIAEVSSIFISFGLSTFIDNIEDKSDQQKK